MDKAIKNYLGLALIATLVALAAAALWYAWAYARSVGDLYPARTFTVTAEGKAVVIPDVATVTSGVVVEGGKDLAALQAQNTERANKIIAFAKNEGMETKDIKTVGYSIAPRYRSYGCGRGACPPAEIVGYSVSQSIEFKIRDLAKAGAIVGGLVGQGANSVSALSFVADDPRRAEDEARAEAIIKASEKAFMLAEAGHFKIGKIVSIYENNGPGPVYGYGGDRQIFQAAEVPAPVIEPGSSDVKVSVSIIYQIR